jgi:hypothetical protein
MRTLFFLVLFLIFGVSLRRPVNPRGGGGWNGRPGSVDRLHWSQ